MFPRGRVDIVADSRLEQVHNSTNRDACVQAQGEKKIWSTQPVKQIVEPASETNGFLHLVQGRLTGWLWERSAGPFIALHTSLAQTLRKRDGLFG